VKHLQTRQVIREVAKKNGLSMEEATSILESIPEFIRETIKNEINKLEGYFPTIKVPGWGTFYVDRSVKQHIKTLLLKRLKEEKNESISTGKLETGN
jgi:nucleoid DNA-binding protein